MLQYIYKYFRYFLLQLTEIKSVDLYFDQFNNQNNGNIDSLPNPRVLIEIPEIQIPINISKQTFEMDVNLHVGIDINSDFILNNIQSDRNLLLLSLLDKITKKLYNKNYTDLPVELQTDTYDISSCIRTGVKVATNTESVKVFILTFRFVLEDNSFYEEDEYATITDIIITEEII